MLNMGTTTINATSRIDDKVVAYFNASISEDGNFSISKSITDKDTYKVNQEQCDTDYAEFEAKAMEYFGVE